MRIWAALMATALLAGTAHAADGPSVTPALSAKGDGNWEMLCHVLVDGELKPTILGPQRSAYTDARMKRADCSYHATAKGDLTVTLIGAESCPFAGAAADACALNVPKGKRGSFKFKASSR